MKKIPDTVVAYKKTPEFTEDSIPNGILSDHQTKEGVWGKIVVLEGCLHYQIQEPMSEVVVLDKNTYGVVEPQVLHHVKPLGAVRFYVEFYR